MSEPKAKIAVIGGSGVYDPEMFANIKRYKVATPYGAPSGQVEIGELDGIKVAFIPRHGKGHFIPPHKINFRANIWALKQLGVERIISASAVGSLQERFKPGHFMIPDQFIDFTKRRELTFYDGGQVVHVSTADPFCAPLSDIFFKESQSLGIQAHKGGTYICVEGPRFSTRAESRMFRQFADIIGMTLVPECQLAREQEICYVCLAMITDYDVWAEKPVNVEEVMRTLAQNDQNTKQMLKGAIPKIAAIEKRDCECATALAGAKM